MTYRERRLAKAERLRGWAEKRQESAAATLGSQPELRRDWTFITQPGHIPERARMNARDDRAYDSIRKADQMEARAAGIERAAAGAIYSDDEDAPERLRAKIIALQAQRDRYKAINKAIRDAKRLDPACEPHLILAGLTNKETITHEEAKELARSYGFQSYHGLGHPAYEITNLGANIRRQQARLVEIERETTEGPRWRYCHAAKYDGTCATCEQPIEKGTPIAYQRSGAVQHFPCYESLPKGAKLED